MCFSPEASLIASAFLAVMSIVSYRKVLLQNSQVAAKLGLVLVTAGFAAQQFCEGLVWLSLLHPELAALKNFATYGFIFFAFIFWPVYIPICMYRLEQHIFLRKLLKLAGIIGFGTGAILLDRIVFFGVTAQIGGCHIMYNSQIAQFSLLLTWVVMGAYLIATVGAMLISSFPGMRVVGVVIGCTYLAAYLFYLNYLISVWCFFAATSSMLIYWLVAKKA